MNGTLLGLMETPSGQLPIGYQGEAHILTIAEPGSGKSRRVAIVNLLVHDGSAVVLDFKGEHALQTAMWRRHVLGHDVKVADPFHIIPDRFLPDGMRCHINPVDFIRASRAPLTAAFRVAESLIPPGSLKESHWADGAQARYAANALFVATDPVLDEMVESAEDFGLKVVNGSVRHMGTVWKSLSNPETEKLFLKLMLESENDFIADQAAAFHKAAKGNTEISGIRNQIRVNLTKMMSEPAILNSMLETNVDFRQMSRRPLTVYICIPGDLATTQFRYPRLIVSIALSEVEAGGLRPRDSSQAPTLFQLDEFTTLGQFPLIVEAMGRMRGYGVRFHTFVQTLSQLQIYGQNLNVITGNAGCLQFFGGTNDTFTAEYISKLSGVGTILKTGGSQNNKPGDSNSTNYSTAARPIFTPDEVMRLPLPHQIIKLSGNNATLGTVMSTDGSEFPQWQASMRAFLSGVSPERAAEIARAVPPKKPVPQSAPAAIRQDKKPRREGLFTKNLLARIMGHETE